MNIHDTLFLIIAIGVWSIWYKLRYGIEKRKSLDAIREQI